MSTSLLDQIKSGESRVFRRLFIKRRESSTGLFETEFVEVTDDVKKWGNIRTSIDVDKPGRFVFENAKLKMENINGRYNPSGQEGSLWETYADQQRTLIKIEAGFVHSTLGADGIWVNTEYPTSSTQVFTGIISGDIFLSSSNDVDLNIKPITQIFKDFPVSELDGFTSTGITASKFVEILRDQTDGSGSFIFRPFLGDTTTNWSIQSTSFTYTNLNTATATDINQRDCWSVLKQLAEAENYAPYISAQGAMRFVNKSATASNQFHFVGNNLTPNTEHGHTIKKILRFGKKLTSFYSRASVKFVNEDTNTSFASTALAFAINGTNSAWNLGSRTFSVQNFWLNTATANSLADSLLTELSSLKNEIHFTTSFIPHLNVLDQVSITYDTSDNSNTESLWDINDWADSTSGTDLIWDSGDGDSFNLDNTPYKLLSINLNLDNLESTFIAREI
jgi:hypothetical protein